MSSNLSMKNSKMMSLKEHGKGYLLIPKKNHKDYGTKYYHNGWWMPKHNAWFFKKEYKEYLEANFLGGKLNVQKKEIQSKNVKELYVKDYGKGLLLVPEEGHPDWGTKYYHNGWWMPKHNAWFFKKEYKDFIMSFSKKKSVSKKTTEDSKKGFNLNFKSHGRGFLLIPEEGHPDWGTKYYHNGWWMPKYNAWFFKKEDKENFIKSLEHPENEVKKTNPALTVKSYGKGYLLVPEKGHPDWGTKYYHNGWWMSKHNAWFFKKEYKDFLSKFTSSTKEESLFSNFDLQKYGKGYLLTVDKQHSDWGEKYYYNGWWFPKLNGWFFKKEWKTFLIDNGATMNKESYEEDNTEMFHGFKLQKYGKGYLMTVDNEHPDWGKKYYFGGWWFPKQNGWFFKKEFVSFLKDNGAE